MQKATRIPVSSRNASSGGVVVRAESSSLLGKNRDALLKRITCQNDKPTLDLSLCLLKRVPLDEIQQYYGKVDSLNLSCNHLRSLPPKFTLRLNTVTKLNLAHNELKRLPDNFGELDKLVDLNVSENQLETLPLSMGKLKKLERLNLSGNPFQSPLYNFLDAENIRINSEDSDPTKVAPSVVQLLRRLSQEVFPSEYFSTPQRAVTFEGDDQLLDGLDEELDSRNADDQHCELVRRNAEMKLFKTEEKSPGWCATFFWKMLGALTTILIICLMIALFPLLLACFYTSPFFQKWVERNPSGEGFWRMYEPIHHIAEDILYSANVFTNRPFQYQGPEPVDFFQSLYKYVADLFTSMLRLISNNENE